MKLSLVHNSQFTVRGLMIGALLITVYCLLSTRPLLAQGPLTPPGPPGPTFKTLDQIEPRTPITNLPYTISAPGSYYVTTNLTGDPGGITISTNDVVLDLNGFELAGGTGAGIRVGSPATFFFDITIRNGSVRGWSGIGIDGGGMANSLYEDLHVSNNSSTGMVVTGGAMVRNCSWSENNGGGLRAIGNGVSIIGCVSRLNTGHGISAGNASTIAHCTARFDTGDGIRAGIGSTVAYCTAIGCTNGIVAAVAYSTVADCAAFGNSNNGIVANTGSTVTDCTAGENGQNGIEVGDSCRVVNNNCTGNGIDDGDGAGIHVSGVSNRIDANNVTGNVRGIQVDNVGNLIIKNSASGNGTNYVIAAGNSVGPTVTSATIGASSSPHANYDF